jgi:NDP-sugar pyrophosphorylase family protein
MKAMLFAAGLGTRLKPFTDKHPKALATVNGKTLLQHNIEYLQSYGVYEVVVNVHHFAEQIEEVINKNNGFGSKVWISDETEEVLETGGGLKKAAPFFKHEDSFLVMNVDILTNLDLARLMEAHDKSRVATLAITNRDSSRHLLFDNDMMLCGWMNNNSGEKKLPVEKEDLVPFAFSGVQMLSREIFSMPFEGKFSMIDVYLYFAKQQLVKGYDHSGDVFIDVGKPESLAKANLLFT